MDEPKNENCPQMALKNDQNMVNQPAKCGDADDVFRLRLKPIVPEKSTEGMHEANQSDSDLSIDGGIELPEEAK